ncbi:MAG TPA: enoyl-CoA hydratase/isomerase family protein [Dehalococcoidia bacterium]|nr:enoyl-CoA hydratase/isomerase family protein [Dehalococcoidia bacterium]
MIDYARYTTIKVEKADRIAVLTLNRPEQLNTINRTMHLELEEVFEDVARDEDIHVAVLTGAGRAFSAGGDMRNQYEWAHHGAPYVDLPMARRIIHSILNVPQPVIAALNGHCIGLSANIVLFCDVIYAAEDALLGDPHVRFGLVAGDSGCVVWPLLAGMVRAKELLLTGDLITAQQAERWGVVNHVVPKDQVLPSAMAMAKRLAYGPTRAIRWTKMCLNKRLREEVNLVLDASLSVEFAETIGKNDHREGVSAFLEKRPPKFTGT